MPPAEPTATAPPARLRLFAGVPLDPALAAEMAARTPAVEGLRAVPPANLHVTVHFMGAVPGERVAPLAATLAGTCARLAPFSLAVERIAGGPRPARRARMVWAHLSASEPFARLVGDLSRACEEFGIAPESRPPRAHVTLARAARGRPVALPGLPAPPAWRVPVDRVVLYRSVVGPRGAAYTALAELPLGSAG